MNREIIINALFNKLVSPPMVVDFTADTTTGDITLANVSSTAGLQVGMPIVGDGLPADATIVTITPEVTISLPATADRSASAMTQGFQTVQRRMADPRGEQDMPALYLVEVNEIYPYRGSTGGALVEINCEVWIYTKVGADQNAIPAATLNTLIDAVERVIYPMPQRMRQNLGVNGVLYCGIEGEIVKDPGHDGMLAGAIIPLKIVVGQTDETFMI